LRACPICTIDLSRVKYEEQFIWKCKKCSGVFLEEEKIRTIQYALDSDNNALAVG
jgi:Zn-finger nucleic acid-binding protein